GGYHDGIEMWQVSMGLTTEIAEGYSYSPEDLRYDINEEYIGGHGSRRLVCRERHDLRLY
ncbi:MAG: hypothetical protein KBB79_05230, partial [Candidatus Omnitrophica bacterium]|nr:hypothetical protein [Candidatus Omnitrophota bacterium]